MSEHASQATVWAIMAIAVASSQANKYLAIDKIWDAQRKVRRPPIVITHTHSSSYIPWFSFRFGGEQSGPRGALTRTCFLWSHAVYTCYRFHLSPSILRVKPQAGHVASGSRADVYSMKPSSGPGNGNDQVADKTSNMKHKNQT
jgi:hypothetical protein